MNALANSMAFWLALFAGLSAVFLLPAIIGLIRRIEHLGIVIGLNFIPPLWPAALLGAFIAPAPPTPARAAATGHVHALAAVERSDRDHAGLLHRLPSGHFRAVCRRFAGSQLSLVEHVNEGFRRSSALTRSVVIHNGVVARAAPRMPSGAGVVVHIDEHIGATRGEPSARAACPGSRPPT